VHACGGANNRREKRHVLIVSVLLPKYNDFRLRSNTPMRAEILRVCCAHFARVATSPTTSRFTGDAEIEELACAESLVSVYYCRTCYKAVRVALMFITAGPGT